MKTIISLALLVLAAVASVAQQPKNLAVQLSATVSEAPQPTITLHWNADKNTTAIQVFRKSKQASSWPAQPLAQPTADALEWTDTDVEVHTTYEYRVIRDVSQEVGRDTATNQPIMRRYWAFGYLLSGIKATPIENGMVLLLVDSTIADAIEPELDVLQQDLRSEGWDVRLQRVARAEDFNSDAVEANRATIKSVESASSGKLSTVLLIGRVAIPYSGAIAPDGHPDHYGAWPADGVYGDKNGMFSDIYIDTNNASRPANANRIGDGKYDQGVFTSGVELAVGRIDFYNMPEFKQSEIELLREYLNKNHAFRTGQVPVVMGGTIDDNFGTYGEYFAAAAWRSFSVFGSDTAVKAADWFGSLAGPTTYLWAYGCGGGTNTSAGGVGTTADFATKPVEAIHTQLFGSYFGDWNTRNNLLRAAIASSPRALTCGWSARPAWYMHHMALGETIGYSLLISQNNRSVVNGSLGTYTPNVIYVGANPSLASIGDGGIHIALMGDPTLKAVMSTIAPVTTLTGSTDYPNGINLSWDQPDPSIDAYMVYRYRSALRGYELITPRPITETVYRDSIRHEGELLYYVRPLVLRTTASGTYYDMGTGAEVGITTTGVDELQPDDGAFVGVWPNPVSVLAHVRVGMPVSGTATIEVVDLAGRIVISRSYQDLAAGEFSVDVDVSPLAVGAYRVLLRTARGVNSQLIHVVR